MKKQIIFLLFAFVVFNSNLQAQIGAKKMNYENVQMFLKTKLLIAIDENDETGVYDSFKESMQKYWKYNEYDFISSNDAEKYLKDEKYSVLALVTLMSSDNKNEVLRYSCKILLGNEDYSALEDATTIASVNLPSSYNSKKKTEELIDYSFLTHFIVRAMINQITDKIEKASIPSIKRIGKAFYFNKDDGYNALHSKKVIYLCEETLNKSFNKGEFCKIFRLEPEKVKILSKEEFLEMLEQSDANVAFLYEYRFDGSIFDGKTFRIIATNDIRLV